jgi:hypothetical protein
MPTDPSAQMAFEHVPDAEPVDLANDEVLSDIGRSLLKLAAKQAKRAA